MNFLMLLSWGLALTMILPLATLSLELTAGFTPLRRAKATAYKSRLAVLIPAHNEEMDIGQTISALYAVAIGEIRIIVVADNCIDRTAEIARSAGAEVVERNEPSARGKGFALDCGRDYLDGNSPPDCVVILDADCRLSTGSLEALARSTAEHQNPAQAINLIISPPGADPLVQISNFAMMVKNQFRSRGMQRLGGAALLTGTGMAFPWPLFANAKLATGSIVEDLALGIDMTRSGHPPCLVEEAMVTSAAAHRDDALAQRTRWEHGFLTSLVRNGIPTLLGGIARRSRREIALGFHLIVPPLALLMLLSVSTILILTFLASFGTGPKPALSLGVVLFYSLALIGLCWLKEGRAYLKTSAALRAPIYVLWKLPIYLKFIRRPSTQWNRTPRR